MILGIDPGKSGGIAMITSNEIGAVKVSDMTSADIVAHLVVLQPFIQKCYIERVQAMPKDGRSSAFLLVTFLSPLDKQPRTRCQVPGETYVKGILRAVRIPIYVPKFWPKVKVDRTPCFGIE